MELRPYQTELVQAARREFAAGKRRVILQMATGGGKTPVGCSIIQSAASKGHEVWMGCHKNFLVEQASEKLKQFGVYHGIVSSSSKYNARQKVHVCGLGVLKNRMHGMRKPSIFLWDECHHIGARTWVEIMEAFPDAFHLGLTATPTRPSGTGLGQWFDSLIVGPSVADLIAWGKLHPGEGLCDYRLFSAKNSVSAEGLHSRGGDFVAEELGELMDTKAIIGDAVDEFKKHASYRKFLTFSPTIKFSEHIAESYRDAGVNCAHLDGSTDKKTIRHAVRDLVDGKIQGITSVAIFLEGLDAPAVNCVQWLRHTKSVVVKMQGDGRGMRNERGKDHLVILDHVQNWKRFGLPDDPIDWSLEGKTKAKAPGETSMTRECEHCYCRYRLSSLQCPECGHRVVFKERVIEQEDGELVEVDLNNRERVELSPERKAQAMAKSIADLVALGHSEGRARHIIAAREEKKAMQDELIAAGWKRSEVWAMKPKQLKEALSVAFIP
jgi:superfamily II DNA or RNA helicase